MKLSVRILLLVVPAIMISTVVSSYIIFSQQTGALIKREESYMQLQMEKLNGHFKQASSFLNSYSYTLTHNPAVRDYFVDVADPYRELELIDNLQQSVNALQPGDETFAGLAILNGQKELIYYGESSNDPFAEIDAKVLQEFTQQATLFPFDPTIKIAHNSTGDHVLFRYDVIDSRTGKVPLRAAAKNTFFVLVTVSLDKFNQLRKEVEYDTDSVSAITAKPPQSEDKELFTVKLAPSLYATLSPAQYLIKNKVRDVWHQVSYSFAIAGLVTVTVILIILYRFVIRPITSLDRQLIKVEQRVQTNITKLHSNDELGRLSRRIYDMYEELDSSYRQAKRLAERDHLTQLHNRRQFQQLAQKALDSCPEEDQATLLYVDLDNFKFVNDKYGHATGDELLVEFSNYLTSLTEQISTLPINQSYISRLSGDEFAILLLTPKNLNDVPSRFAEAIIANKQHGNGLKRYPVTTSVGLASYPNDGLTIEKLVSNADAAMYQSKNNGKNQYSFYSEDINQAIQRRANIEQALREDAVFDELTLHYQPYVSAKLDQVVGVEVLLRWFSPTLGVVTPDEFIPLAESRGLFNRIDRYVIEQAFIAYQEIQELLGDGTKVSINISSAELSTLTLAEYIEQKRIQYHVKAEHIEFEITETYAYQQEDYPLLDKLSQLGFQLAIDDFGSGYTSLAQLVQYPVQKIKFDRMFLNSLIETNNRHVMEPLIQLCHSQQKMVTAEGIEDSDMHQWLTEYNCDLMQGYHFARPMVITELATWLDEFQPTLKQSTS